MMTFRSLSLAIALLAGTSATASAQARYDMIAAQRAYEMNAKVISAADQMLQTASALFR